MINNSPEDFGWKELGVNSKTDRIVWGLDGCQLTKLYSSGWFARNRHGCQYHLTDGTMQEYTEFILNDTRTPLVCRVCGNAFDSRLPDEPEPENPLCDMCPGDRSNPLPQGKDGEKVKITVTSIYTRPLKENNIPSQARDLLEIIKRGLDSGRFKVVDGTIVLNEEYKKPD